MTLTQPNTVIDAPAFDITLTMTNDYRGVPRYLLRYGLQTQVCEDMVAAMREFWNCTQHALECHGYVSPEED